MASNDLNTAEELGLFVENVQDYAIFLLAPDGRIRSWNLGAARIFGYEAAEVIGQSFSLFYEPVDLEQHKPETELRIAAAEGRVVDEGWRLRKDGTRFWANTVITSVRAPDGSIRGFAKVTRDLSERNEGDERLRESAEIFRLLVAAVKDYAIFMLDPDGNVATWNTGAARIKGYTAEEIIGKHFSTFYPEEDLRSGKPKRELEIAIANGSVEDEGWRLRKDGTRFWANVVITAIHGADGRLRGFTKVTRDVTDRRRAEEMQRSLLEQREARLQAEEERRRAESSYRIAQEANRAKDEFLMTLSHELRTPMTAILGWARLLPSMSPSDPAFKDAITSISRGAQLQARLIDDVLDVSRIVSGKLRLNVEEIDLRSVVNAAIETVQASADAKYIEIQVSFAPNLGTTVADGTRLQQIIWNLLANAVKFTPKHGTIRVAVRKTSSHVQIEVADSGEGIDPAFLPHLFEPFRQAENPSTRIHGGLGLGLSIVRYLAEAHGGTVAAESKGRGSGATFTVTLPIAPLTAHTTSHSAGQEGATAGPRRLSGVDILLVDDDEAGRSLVRTVLQQAGALVTDVDSAAHALSSLGAHRPDLVITDIAMPQMDGYALLREIRQVQPLHGLKVVALSAFPAGKRGEKNGFDEYLSKPIDPSALVDSIAGIVHAS